MVGGTPWPKTIDELYRLEPPSHQLQHRDVWEIELIKGACDFQIAAALAMLADAPIALIEFARRPPPPVVVLWTGASLHEKNGDPCGGARACHKPFLRCDLINGLHHIT